MVEDLVRTRRCVFFAGLPGTGKSLLVRRAAVIGAGLGRDVHLLRWDVARLAFDRAEILAWYPEVDSVTHPAIRIAAGLWARRAVLEWHRAHREEAILIGEAPLAGERFMSLARPIADDLEPLLRGEQTVFAIAVPSAEVRAAIERARARDVETSADASAPPHLVRRHWDEIARVARELALGSATEYDHAVYEAAYRYVLRWRHAVALHLREVLVPERVALPEVAELVPDEAEVARAMAEVERLGAREVAARAEGWYRL